MVQLAGTISFQERTEVRNEVCIIFSELYRKQETIILKTLPQIDSFNSLNSGERL